jgi:adenylylsulfate kinase-like enzyme
MKLIFLHGPPAAGKFTIAKELEILIGCGVFHNHLTIDTAKPFFEFGTENFWELAREIRFACLKAGAKYCAGVVVYTSCYSHPTDLKQFEEIEQIITDSGSELFPVFLKCSLVELERRVADPLRVSMGKVRSIKGLHEVLDQWNFVAVPRENCVTISNDDKSPLQCAKEIIDVLNLDG